MNEFDSNLTKKLEDFMESYKMIDVEQIYSNGTEFVPIFRVKQWLEYNNINNLQSKIDKAIEYLTSYDAISTIQGLDNIKKNKELDENTMNIMTNRYLEVHHKLLKILKEDK